METAQVYDQDLPPELQPGPPLIYSVVRRTWLDRPPNATAQAVAAGTLLLLMIACVAQWQSYFGLGDLWPATKNEVFAQGQYWRLWTTLFTHGDMGHLLANSMLFYILGYFLYGYFGGLVFPTAAVFFGGIINAFSIYSYPPEVRLIGASGMVSWMGGAWLALYFMINTRLTKTQRALRSFGVALVLFAPSEAFDPKISYRTHLIGFALGIAWGLIYYFWNQTKFNRAEYRETIVD